MSSNQSMSFSVAVTPGLRHAFDSLEIKGKGGFQALMRSVAERVTSSAALHSAQEALEGSTR